MPKHTVPFLDLAKRGAEMPLQDLLQELRYLIDLFPHLRDSFDEGDLPVGFLIARDSRGLPTTGSSGAPGRQGRMSPAERKAAGKRMKRYGSARRKAVKG